MKPKGIVFLDDLLRKDFLNARAFIYQLILEPLRQALEIDLPDTSLFPRCRGLTAEFQEEKFQELCSSEDWVKVNFKIPSAASQYLLESIPQSSITIGYEMPKWLIETLNSNKLPWIDIRLSPIRFGRDLYLVLRSNSLNLRQSLQHRLVTDNEIKIEAGLMRAASLHNQIGGKHPNERLQHGLLFIGQTKFDSSLISDDGRLLRAEDFSEEIKELSQNRRIFYKSHPSDKSWARTEKVKLEKILGTKIEIITQGTYSLLAGSTPFELVGISSGVLQEADYFEKKATILHKPACNFKDENSSHIRFMDFISPALWREVFDIPLNPNTLQEVPRIPHNAMRKLHNAWWGYSNFMLENDNFHREAFIYGLQQKIRRPFRILEKILFRQQ